MCHFGCTVTAILITDDYCCVSRRAPAAPCRDQPVQAGSTTAPSGDARLNRVGDAHLIAHAKTGKCHFSPSSSSDQEQAHSESMPPPLQTVFTPCCTEPKITKNLTTKECRSNLPAAVWRLLGFSARCRQQWSYQAVTGLQTGTGHLCLGQSRCPGERPSRTSQAVWHHRPAEMQEKLLQLQIFHWFQFVDRRKRMAQTESWAVLLTTPSCTLEERKPGKIQATEK